MHNLTVHVIKKMFFLENCAKTVGKVIQSVISDNCVIFLFVSKYRYAVTVVDPFVLDLVMLFKPL